MAPHLQTDRVEQGTLTKTEEDARFDSVVSDGLRSSLPGGKAKRAFPLARYVEILQTWKNLEAGQTCLVVGESNSGSSLSVQTDLGEGRRLLKIKEGIMWRWISSPADDGTAHGRAAEPVQKQRRSEAAESKVSDVSSPSRGSVLKWDERKGHGFIMPDGADERIFVHFSQLPRNYQHGGDKILKPGDRVAFDIQTDPKKGGRVAATNLRVGMDDSNNISGEDANAESSVGASYARGRTDNAQSSRDHIGEDRRMLPHPWVQVSSPEGDYFFNEQTGASQWERP